MIKYLLGACIVVLFTASTAQAWCLAGKGTTCDIPENNSFYPPSTAQSQNTININSQASSPSGPSDGGILNKLSKGDKSKEQGYAKYKKHFLYYGYQFYSTPNQNYLKKSTSPANRSLGYEYAFNPFVSLKLEKFQLQYEGVEEQQMKQEHMALTLNARIYLLNHFVLRAGAGISNTKINKSGEEETGFDQSKGGTTEVIQVSIFYIFGDEDTMIGFTSSTFTGLAGTENIGSSNLALNVSIGFK